MSKSNLLSDEEIRELLRPTAEEIVKDVNREMNDAIREFYSHGNEKHTYNRTGTFVNFATNGDIVDKGDSLQLVFEYTSDDISVNPWANYPGSEDWAFDADFINGWHGGPRRTPLGFTWDGVTREDISPWNRIKTYVEQKY